MATRNELEAVLEDAPLDDAGFRVFGDWLQAAGDPRGELIAIDDGALRAPAHARTRWQERRRDLLARHPELAPPSDETDELAYRWHLGFVRTLVVRTRSKMRPLAEVLAHPALRFVSTIALDSYRSVETAMLAEIVAHAPRSLRTLTIARESYQSHDMPALELDPALAGLPQLAQLTVAVPCRFTQAGSLRALELFGTEPGLFDWLPRVPLPGLDSLVLHAGTRAMLRWTDVKRLVEAPLPALRALGLHHTIRGDEIVAGLATTSLLRQLRTLALWNAGLTAAGARHITPEAFGHLELLDLSDAGLDENVARELARVCREVRCIPERITSSRRRPPSSARS